MYYSIKNMDIPTAEMYDVKDGQSVLLIGTCKRQDWAISVDIDRQSPCSVFADGLHLPFSKNSFDIVILDYVTNFLPKDWMVRRLIREANRVGLVVKGRATVTGNKSSLSGPKQRFSHVKYPDGVEWIC